MFETNRKFLRMGKLSSLFPSVSYVIENKLEYVLRKETKRLSKNLKDLIEKSQNLIFLPRSRIGASSSLESSMKRFLRRIESKQNKSKQIKINDVFDHFTSKA